MYYKNVLRNYDLATNYNISQLHIIWIYIYIHICISKKGNLGQIKCPNNTYICILLAAVPTKSIKLLGSLHASFHKILILLTFSFAWASCIREHTKSWVLSYQGKYVHQENCHKANRDMGRYRCNQERLKYIGGDTSTQSISYPLPYPIGSNAFTNGVNQIST